MVNDQQTELLEEGNRSWRPVEYPYAPCSGLRTCIEYMRMQRCFFDLPATSGDPNEDRLG